MYSVVIICNRFCALVSNLCIEHVLSYWGGICSGFDVPFPGIELGPYRGGLYFESTIAGLGIWLISSRWFSYESEGYPECLNSLFIDMVARAG